MADADATDQQPHRGFVEYILHQPVAFVHAQLVAVHRGNAGGILATVLQDGESVVQRCRDFTGADDSDDAAHGVISLLRACKTGLLPRFAARPCAGYPIAP
jgi:hypothetical protein